MEVDPLLFAMSDPTRRAVFELVARESRSVADLASNFPVSRPAISQHLKVLLETGLVTVTDSGTRRIYTAAPEGLAVLRAWTDQVWDRLLDRYTQAASEEAHMTNLTDRVVPVVKTRVVPLSQWEAFDLFTTRMVEWWPVVTHSINGEDTRDVRFEGHVGGGVIEVGPTGEEVRWADVTAWSPPHRFRLSWHPNPDPVAASALEVRFFEEPEGGTRLVLEHSGWEEFGDEAMALRDQYESGWDIVLEPYLGACAR